MLASFLRMSCCVLCTSAFCRSSSRSNVVDGLPPTLFFAGGRRGGSGEFCDSASKLCRGDQPTLRDDEPSNDPSTLRPSAPTLATRLQSASCSAAASAPARESSRSSLGATRGGPSAAAAKNAWCSSSGSSSTIFSRSSATTTFTSTMALTRLNETKKKPVPKGPKLATRGRPMASLHESPVRTWNMEYRLLEKSPKYSWPNSLPRPVKYVGQATSSVSYHEPDAALKPTSARRADLMPSRHHSKFMSPSRPMCRKKSTARMA
mmetsp:Transcript_21204/g.73161  ORF Transcript_21204/g.73161 Transcript_21204/m.73161 type:complete len:263 (-) Transcript_21204:50-838(-)